MPAPMTGSGAAGDRRCRACERGLANDEEVFWECECGAVVCEDPACFEECFKFVAGGEATRCLVCGLVT